jgi:hypothetical protein
METDQMLATMTVKSLRSLAREFGVKLNSKMTKDEIISAIRVKQGISESPKILAHQPSNVHHTVMCIPTVFIRVVSYPNTEDATFDVSAELKDYAYRRKVEKMLYNTINIVTKDLDMAAWMNSKVRLECGFIRIEIYPLRQLDEDDQNKIMAKFREWIIESGKGKNKVCDSYKIDNDLYMRVE